MGKDASAPAGRIVSMVLRPASGFSDVPRTLSGVLPRAAIAAASVSGRASNGQGSLDGCPGEAQRVE